MKILLLVRSHCRSSGVAWQTISWFIDFISPWATYCKILHLSCGLLCAALGLAGCATKNSLGGSGTARPVQFTDITKAAGINWQHYNGAFGLRWTPEVIGSGVAFVDADGDGYQDIFLVNGRDWTDDEIAAYERGNGRKHHLEHGFVVPPHGPRQRHTCALYHNNGNGTFTDITRAAGLDVEMYGMGVCVGDYDNDGRPDIYVTGYGRNYLFHNESQGHHIKFREVAAAMGVSDGGWSVSATWIDYNRDGKLDLFVTHYMQWTPAVDFWLDNNGAKNYSSPDHYKPVLSTLYRNDGDHFTDVSKQAGITEAMQHGKQEKLWSKGMGVALCDYNNDQWPDIIVTNDRMVNQLFKNNGNGTFTEVANQAGIAYSGLGVRRSGMGVAVGDIDHSNRESIAIANFNTEMLGLYQNQGNGLFTDIAGPAGIAELTLPYVGFSCAFLDIDNDGWLDLMLANGHVYDRLEAGHKEDYAEPMLLFRNRSGDSDVNVAATPKDNASGTAPQRIFFEEVDKQSGEVFNTPVVGRGLACADIDLDGDVDMLVTSNNSAPLLLRNDGGNKNNSIRVVLRGTKSNRDGIGAGVWAQVGKELLRRRVQSGSAYLSQSELPVTLGLGQSKQADLVAVRWPSGKLAQFKNVAANQIITIDEDKGIVRQQPFKR